MQLAANQQPNSDLPIFRKRITPDALSWNPNLEARFLLNLDLILLPKDAEYPTLRLTY